jgi:hypothetical protein
MSEKIESWEGIDDRIRVKGGGYRLIELLITYRVSPWLAVFAHAR